MGSDNLTICEFGCFMSDWAMVLNYYNITIDGQIVNPGNLNEWLRVHKEYF